MSSFKFLLETYPFPLPIKCSFYLTFLQYFYFCILWL
ncbi:hypothetical protein [Bacillus phage FI_KG-Lek]|nr:hypothetical protein [Bacillus phage FI_KG-Lek]